MHIRTATPQDAKPLRQLRLQALQTNPEAFGSSYEEELAQPLELTERRLQDAAKSPDTFTLVIEGELDGQTQLVGMAGFVRTQRQKRQHIGIIWGVYLSPAVRGQGWGRRLMAAIIDRAKQLDGLEQILISVVTENVAARQLYQSLGFEVYGLEPRALKLAGRYLDEEFMLLRLS